MLSETITYNGFKFQRYPESKNRSERVYYTGWVGKHKKRLHRYIYECEIGIIEKGMHIHHKDENPLNNDISNLEKKEKRKHLSEHYNSKTDEQKAFTKNNFIEKVIPCAKIWHSSKEGIDWHREHAKNSLMSDVDIEKNCPNCSVDFKTKVKRQKYCTTRCDNKYKARRLRERLRLAS